VDNSVESADPSGPSLRLVLGAISILAVVLGVLAFWRLSLSEQHVARVLVEMDRKGPTLDTEGCIGAVLDWHSNCEADAASCDYGVAPVLTHCLVGADRSATCEGLDLSSAKAEWVHQACFDRGTPCRDRKHCACADAYRAIDSFCRHGQKGVAL